MPTSSTRPAAVALVVGAGPVGILAAAELTRRGVDCRLIDRAEGPAGLSKAAGVQARTLEIFEDIGIVDRFLDRGVRWNASSLYANGERLGRMTFGGLDTRYPFMLSIPQDETERFLTDHLSSLGGEIEWGVELVGFEQDEDGVRATLRHGDREEAVDARWVVGCDGPGSTVRDVVGAPYSGGDYPTSYALADIHMDWDGPGDEGAAYLKHEGALQVYPLPDDRWRLFVDRGPIQPGGRPPPPSVEDIQGWVDEYLPGRARVYDPMWMTYFMVHHRHVHRMRHGRAFLCGDAAHAHSPITLQGMNAGLQDAYNLAWKLELVAKGVAGDELLESFSAERLPVDTAIVHQAGLLERLTTLRRPVEQAIRDRLMPILYGMDAFTRQQASQLAETEINYRGSPVVGGFKEHSHLSRHHAVLWHGSHPGDRLPAVHGLVDSEGERLTLAEAIRGSGHRAVLLVGAPPDEGTVSRHLDAIAVARDLLGGQVDGFVLAADGQHVPELPSGVRFVADPEFEAHRQLGVSADTLILLRPDGYVGFRSEPPNADEMRRHLEGAGYRGTPAPATSRPRGSE